MGKPGGGPPSPFAPWAKAAPCGRWRGIAPREGGRVGQGMKGREEERGKKESLWKMTTNLRLDLCEKEKMEEMGKIPEKTGKRLANRQGLWYYNRA